MPLAAAPHTANMTRVPGRPAREGRPFASRDASVKRAAQARPTRAGRPGPVLDQAGPEGHAAWASENASPVLPRKQRDGPARAPHQRSPANGPKVSVQPSGSTQVSQDGPLAPVGVADRAGEERDAEHPDRQAARGPGA